jgi:hypothetical protein
MRQPSTTARAQRRAVTTLRRRRPTEKANVVMQQAGWDSDALDQVIESSSSRAILDRESGEVQRDLPDSSAIRVSVAIQFTSHVLPPSLEYDCSK